MKKIITTLALGLLLPCLCMAQTSISINRVWAPGENITIHYEGSNYAKDWVGIYKYNNPSPSIQWIYAENASGDLTFNSLNEENLYYAGIYENDGYTELDRKYFIVCERAKNFKMSLDKEVYTVGEPITITWENAPAFDKDWIAIYHKGHTPGGNEQISTSYKYVDGNINGSMTLNVPGTPNFNLHDGFDEPGEYYITYLFKDGYYEVFDRISYTVVKGTKTFNETFENTFAPAKLLADVTISRTIKEGYNTVCLPFDLTAEQVAAAFGDGTKVYAFSENSDDANNATINFTETSTISANVPVLVKATKASDSQVFENVRIIGPTADPKVEGKNFDFVGTYAPMTVAEGDYFIGGGKLYKSKGNTNMNAFRAYIQAKTDAPVKLFIGDFETSINELNATPDLSEATFNVAGQRIAGMQKGINIVNGKKILK